MKNRRQVIAALGAATALSACAVQLPGSGTPPRQFVLSPKSTFDDDAPTVDWQLLIDSPIAAAGLNTTRIALRHSALELNYFANAAWTDPAPKMVQRLMIESFENSGRIVSVGRQTVGLRADYILTTDLREFQAEYASANAPPEIRARINAKLVRMPQRRIVASETYEYIIPSEGTSIEAVIHAFDDALGKILKRVVTWALVEGEKNRTA